MGDAELHALVREACEEVREYVKSPSWVRGDSRLRWLLGEIERAIRFREFDAFQASQPKPMRCNPWGC